MPEIDCKLLKLLDIPVLAYGEPSFIQSAYLSGCSDYIKTPVTRDELYFCIQKNIRHTQRKYTWGNIIITRFAMESIYYKVHLNYQQFLILELLLKHMDTPVPRESFQYLLWGEVRKHSRNIDVQIAAIRKKIFQLNSGNKIKTIKGLGYMVDSYDCG